MRHAFTPTREDPMDKVVIGGDRVTVAGETVIDPVASQSLNRAVERGKNGTTKEKAWEDPSSRTRPFKAS